MLLQFIFINHYILICSVTHFQPNENTFSYLNNDKPKQEWPEDLQERFGEIRHRLLDQANAIRRLPDNIYYKGSHANSMSFSEFIARTKK